MLINGVVVDGIALDEVKDADKIVINGGVVFADKNDRSGCSAMSHFNRWKKAQTTQFVSVQVSNDDVQALQELLTQFGQGRTNFKVTLGG
ncbi:hypothetical protein [Xanthomonas sp. WG16]|uniref:hypothetical protein n=2 Tax=Xanthomonas TaxID=338 RepID=UPI001CBA615A|nr:hypothetical protein [Xanthomonas sp. WG16]